MCKLCIKVVGGRSKRLAYQYYLYIAITNIDYLIRYFATYRGQWPSQSRAGSMSSALSQLLGSWRPICNNESISEQILLVKRSSCDLWLLSTVALRLDEAMSDKKQWTMRVHAHVSDDASSRSGDHQSVSHANIAASCPSFSALCSCQTRAAWENSVQPHPQRRTRPQPWRRSAKAANRAAYVSLSSWQPDP